MKFLKTTSLVSLTLIAMAFAASNLLAADPPFKATQKIYLTINRMADFTNAQGLNGFEIRKGSDRDGKLLFKPESLFRDEITANKKPKPLSESFGNEGDEVTVLVYAYEELPGGGGGQIRTGKDGKPVMAEFYRKIGKSTEQRLSAKGSSAPYKELDKALGRKTTPVYTVEMKWNGDGWEFIIKVGPEQTGIPSGGLY